jgi:hypothetical protein
MSAIRPGRRRTPTQVKRQVLNARKSIQTDFMNVVATGLWPVTVSKMLSHQGDGPQGRGYMGYSCISPSDAVGSVQRRLRWSGRCGMLVIARGPFRVRFGGPFGSPPGFHRRRKLSATFRRKIQFFLRLLSGPSVLRSGSLRRLGSCASGTRGRFSRGFQLLCCFRRL